MPDKDIKLQGFETVRTWASLIITLSTGTIVFTATFLKDLAPEGGALKFTELLWAAWVTLGFAAVLGIFVIGSLAAMLNMGEVDDLDAYEPTTKWCAVGQFVLFVIGIGFFAVFAYLNFRGGTGAA